MLSPFIEEQKIIFDLHAHSISDALTAMVGKSSEVDKATILAKVLDRENVMSTALGKGIALPRVHLLDKTRSEVIIGISPHGINARGFDLVPIKIIILFLFSPNDDHASILAESLQILNDDTVRTELLQARSAGELIERIRVWEEA
jgi:mannitol/fructose-specific phosphotransferase system IIA component (Ntr-type)